MWTSPDQRKPHGGVCVAQHARDAEQDRADGRVHEVVGDRADARTCGVADEGKVGRERERDQPPPAVVAVGVERQRPAGDGEAFEAKQQRRQALGHELDRDVDDLDLEAALVSGIRELAAFGAPTLGREGRPRRVSADGRRMHPGLESWRRSGRLLPVAEHVVAFSCATGAGGGAVAATPSDVTHLVIRYSSVPKAKASSSSATEKGLSR
jgi:hypothetical protein